MPAGEAAFPGAGGPWAAAPGPQFAADPQPLGCFPAPARRALGRAAGAMVAMPPCRRTAGSSEDSGTATAGWAQSCRQLLRCALRAGGHGGSTTGWSWRCIGHRAQALQTGERGSPAPLLQHVLREPHPLLLTWSVVIGWQDCSLPASPAPAASILYHGLYIVHLYSFMNVHIYFKRNTEV